MCRASIGAVGRFFLGALLCSVPHLFGQIQGIVVGANDQQPLAEAQVRIQGAATKTQTDGGGFFSLDDSRPFPFKLVAGAKGFYNRALTLSDAGDLENLIFELTPVDTTVTADHPFNAPSDCSGCHPNQFSEWRSSAMAQTGLNRWVFDLLSGDATEGGAGGFVYQRDSVHRFNAPNSDCSACHSPVHWLSDIENAGMGDFHNPNQAMREGVQCEVCHRAFDLDDNRLNWPGVFPQSFHLLRGPQVVQFGLLGDADYADTHIMRPAFNPILEDKLCASCHEDNNDHDGDGDFEDPGSVPHETTWSEYQRYRQNADPETVQTCVGCHMPATNSSGFCSFSPVIRDAGTIRDHDIRGTTTQYLENALEMTVDLNLRSVRDPEMSVTVTLLNNQTGHAVPTGIAIRNMILLVAVRDSGNTRLTHIEGDTVDAAGGVGDPEAGYFAGLPGTAFYKNLGRGETTRVFYTEADRLIGDNRIQPGESYAETFSFLADAGLDQTGPISVDVRLIYRRAFFDLIQAKNWMETGLGRPLPDIEPPHFGTLMARDQQTTDFCSLKNLDTTPGIQVNDLRILASHWQEASPYPLLSAQQTTILDLVAAASCLQPSKKSNPGGRGTP